MYFTCIIYLCYTPVSHLSTCSTEPVSECTPCILPVLYTRVTHLHYLYYIPVFSERVHTLYFTCIIYLYYLSTCSTEPVSECTPCVLPVLHTCVTHLYYLPVLYTCITCLLVARSQLVSAHLVFYLYCIPVLSDYL